MAETIQQVLAEQLVRGLKTPGLGFLTVTGVSVTPDLRHARVLVSVYGKEHERRETMVALERATGHLRAEVARALQVKFVPTLAFKLDESIERGARMDAAIRGALESDRQLAALREDSLPPPRAGSTDGASGGGQTALDRDRVDPRQAVAQSLLSAQRVLVTGHADPDGDVAGGCSALYVALRRLGKDVVLFNPDPFPPGYRHLPGAQDLVNTVSDTAVFDATVVLDAAHPHKVDVFLPQPRRRQGTRLWVDHHPLTGPSGDVEWVDVDASAMGEMLHALFVPMGVVVDRELGMGLYASLLADTGGFRYESTTPRALSLAAELVALGVRPWEVAEQVYERQPAERVRLLGRVLASLTVSASGRSAVVTVLRKDLEATGATLAMTDGMINHARAIEGVEMAAQLDELDGGRWRVTLRSRGALEASAVAARLGEKGHRFGACFLAEGSVGAVRNQLERAVDEAAAAQAGV
jgi:phosphoesterase RecJ-like protein